MSVRSEILALLRERPEDVARVLRLLRPAPAARVSSVPEAVAVVSPLLLGRETEALVAVALDRRRSVVDVAILSTGSDAFCIVDSACILRWVLTRSRSCSAVILAHNHPSGDPTPSAQDVEVTRRVATAGRAVGVTLLDHIVVSDTGSVSMAERGDVTAQYPQPVGHTA